jgi:K+-transporting ATPase ATPase B chain
MFIVEVGAAFTTVLAIMNPSVFAWLITAWLWLTVVFANLAESVAEDRGKAQAATLRRAKRNLLIYGLGGVIAPFVGIKLIDLVVQFIPGM